MYRFISLGRYSRSLVLMFKVKSTFGLRVIPVIFSAESFSKQTRLGRRVQEAFRYKQIIETELSAESPENFSIVPYLRLSCSNNTIWFR